MAKELAKTYDPKGMEDRLYQKWMKKKYFHAEVDRSRKPFTIVIPPPNITGQLHMGHALDNTMQDILIRFKRMQGYNALWQPGTDHASIATEVKIIEKLKEEGISKEDLGREGFLERAWEWKKEYGGRIIEQLKKMGSSCDWDRERFTMDEGCNRAVTEVFCKMHEKGWIYKGSRIINWCPVCNTSISDAEVEYEEQAGHFWHIRYPLLDENGQPSSTEFLEFATTRPETMLGDTAVAVNPEDDRYKHLIGRKVMLPLINREIPIVGDSYVDMEFGTGVVKITPAHDPNDFEVGKRHNLPEINIMNDDATINANGGKFQGMDRYEARAAIVKELKEMGLLVKIEDYSHNVGTHDRCKTTIEPLIKKQWFVKMDELIQPAVKAVKEGEIKLVPERMEKTFFNWTDNIRDWCISRQLWWGHRIPAWTCQDCGELIVAEQDPAVCPKCGKSHLEQDPDVLDTWFSSALWPFSTMGWPKETEDLKTFYPTNVLVTAFDILFFWVARMIMMGQHFMGEIPFKQVYIHALVRDAQGRKMSKSLGNGIDPLDMISKYGADALRFTLTSLAAMGRDIRLSEERIEGNRNFVNKVWNASRFALMNLEGNKPEPVDLSKITSLHHAWILHRLEEVKVESETALNAYRFNDLAQCLYKFVWNEFCDWYLELIKGDFKGTAEQKKEASFVLYTVLSEILILLHPIMPFVTSEIWQALPGNEDSNLAAMLRPELRPECLKEKEASAMLYLQEVIVAVRAMKSELGIAPSLKLKALIKPLTDEQADLLEHGRAWLMFLARLEDFEISKTAAAPKASASNIIQGSEITILLEGVLDFKAELARLEKELAKIDKELTGIEARLSNENFVAHAPEAVVAKDKEKAADLTDKKAKLLTLQKRFQEALA